MSVLYAKVTLMRRWLILILSILTVASAAWGAGALSNRRAPGFSLPDLNLQQHDLYKFRGKVVLLNIMRTECPHCAEFSKNLARVENKYTGRVKVIDIVNPPDNQATVQRYLADNGLSQLMLFDCGQVAASYMKITPQNPKFETPHFFVIDQRGWIQEDHGYNALNRSIFEGEGLDEIVEKYLE